MHPRAIAWERSLESMKVGVALYDRDDRLINCNQAFRELYSEIAHLLVPGAGLDDLVTAYYKVAPPEVIDGRTLAEFMEASASPPERLRSHRGRAPPRRSLASDDRLS